MHRRSLRLRLLVTFGLGALILSSLFASLTYFGVKHVLVDDQQQTDLRQSYANAALIRSTLYTSPGELDSILNSIEQASDSNVLVRTHNQWLSKSTGAATKDVSSTVINLVNDGHAVQQTLNSGGEIIFVVGVPIPAVETQVFEVFRLAPLEHTLRVLLQVMGAGALLTSLIGMGCSWRRGSCGEANVRRPPSRALRATCGRTRPRPSRGRAGRWSWARASPATGPPACRRPG